MPCKWNTKSWWRKQNQSPQISYPRRPSRQLSLGWSQLRLVKKRPPLPCQPRQTKGWLLAWGLGFIFWYMGDNSVKLMGYFMGIEYKNSYGTLGKGPRWGKAGVQVARGSRWTSGMAHWYWLPLSGLCKNNTAWPCRWSLLAAHAGTYYHEEVRFLFSVL